MGMRKRRKQKSREKSGSRSFTTPEKDSNCGILKNLSNQRPKTKHSDNKSTQNRENIYNRLHKTKLGKQKEFVLKTTHQNK